MSDPCRVWLSDAYLCPGHRLFGVIDGTSLDEAVIFHQGMPESQLLDARISHAWINQDARDSGKMPESRLTIRI